MPEIHTFAILYPAPGKADRMRELLVKQCKNSFTQDYTLRFLVTEPIDEEVSEFVMFETYKSAQASDQHNQEPYFQECFATFQKEELMAKPPLMYRTISTAGFDMDRKLL
ncbi:hypothetical protein LTR17_014562 [Elasticomyces elasticus]|nr:hypothetical protein LTR17_014562 [Elasticomyces elasticus]